MKTYDLIFSQDDYEKLEKVQKFFNISKKDVFNYYIVLFYIDKPEFKDFKNTKTKKRVKMKIENDIDKILCMLEKKYSTTRKNILLNVLDYAHLSYLELNKKVKI